MTPIQFAKEWSTYNITKIENSFSSKDLIDSLMRLYANDTDILKWSSLGIRASIDDQYVDTLSSKVGSLTIDGKTNFSIEFQTSTIMFDTDLESIVIPASMVQISSIDPRLILQKNANTDGTPFYSMTIDTSKIDIVDSGKISFETYNDEPEYLDTHFMSSMSDINSFLYPERFILWTNNGELADSSINVPWADLDLKLSFAFRYENIFNTGGLVKISSIDPNPAMLKDKFNNKIVNSPDETSSLRFKSLIVKEIDGVITPFVKGIDNTADAKVAFYIESIDLFQKLKSVNGKVINDSVYTYVDRWDINPNTLRDDRESPVIINGKLYETYGISDMFHNPDLQMSAIPVRSIVKDVDGKPKIFFYIKEEDIDNPQLITEPYVTFDEPVPVASRQDATVYNIVSHIHVHPKWRWHINAYDTNEFNYRIAADSLAMVDNFLNPFREENLSIKWSDGKTNAQIDAPLWGLTENEIVQRKGQNTQYLRSFFKGAVAIYRELQLNIDQFTSSFLVEVSRPATAKVNVDNGSSVVVDLSWYSKNKYSKFAWIDTDPKYFDISTLHTNWVGFRYLAKNGNTAFVTNRDNIYPFQPYFEYSNGVKYLVLPEYFYDNLERIQKTLDGSNYVAQIEFLYDPDEIDPKNFTKRILSADTQIIAQISSYNQIYTKSGAIAQVNLAWMPGLSSMTSLQKKYVTSNFDDAQAQINSMMPGIWTYPDQPNFRIEQPKWFRRESYEQYELSSKAIATFRKVTEDIYCEDISIELNGTYKSSTTTNVLVRCNSFDDSPSISMFIQSSQTSTVVDYPLDPSISEMQISGFTPIWPEWIRITQGNFSYKSYEFDGKSEIWAVVPYQIELTNVEDKQLRSCKVFFETASAATSLSVVEIPHTYIIPQVDDIRFKWHGSETFVVGIDTNATNFSFTGIPDWLEVSLIEIEKSLYVQMGVVSANPLPTDRTANVILKASDNSECLFTITNKAFEQFASFPSANIVDCSFESGKHSDWIYFEIFDKYGTKFDYTLEKNSWSSELVEIELSSNLKMVRALTKTTNLSSSPIETSMSFNFIINGQSFTAASLPIVVQPYNQGKLYFDNEYCMVPSKIQDGEIWEKISASDSGFEVFYDSINDSKMEISKFFNWMVINPKKDNTSIDIDTNEFRDWTSLAEVAYDNLKGYSKHSKLAIVQPYSNPAFDAFTSTQKIPVIEQSSGSINIDGMEYPDIKAYERSTYPEGRTEISLEIPANGDQFTIPETPAIVTIGKDLSTNGNNYFVSEIDMLRSDIAKIISCSMDSVCVPKHGTLGIAIDIKANCCIDISKNGDWFDIETIPTGVQLVAKKNTTRKTRRGSITIDAGSYKKSIPVYQHPNTIVDICTYPLNKGGIVLSFGLLLSSSVTYSSDIAYVGNWQFKITKPGQTVPINLNFAYLCYQTKTKTNSSELVEGVEWQSINAGMFTYYFPIVCGKSSHPDVVLHNYEKSDDSWFDSNEFAVREYSAEPVDISKVQQYIYKDGEWTNYINPNTQSIEVVDSYIVNYAGFNDTAVIARPYMGSSLYPTKIVMGDNMVDLYVPYNKIGFRFFEQQQRFSSKFYSQMFPSYKNRIIADGGSWTMQWLKANGQLIEIFNNGPICTMTDVDGELMFETSVGSDNTTDSRRSSSYMFYVPDIGAAILTLTQVKKNDKFIDIVNMPSVANKTNGVGISFKVRSSDKDWTIVDGSNWAQWNIAKNEAVVDEFESKAWQISFDAQMPMSTTRRVGYVKFEADGIYSFYRIMSDWMYMPRISSNACEFSSFTKFGLMQTKTIFFDNTPEISMVYSDHFVSAPLNKIAFDSQSGQMKQGLMISVDDPNTTGTSIVDFCKIKWTQQSQNGTNIETYIKYVPVVQKRFSMGAYVKRAFCKPGAAKCEPIVEFDQLPFDIFSSPYLQLTIEIVNAQRSSTEWLITAPCEFNLTNISNYCIDPIRIIPLSTNFESKELIFGIRIKTIGKSGFATTDYEYLYVNASKQMSENKLLNATLKNALSNCKYLSFDPTIQTSSTFNTKVVNRIQKCPLSSGNYVWNLTIDRGIGSIYNFATDIPLVEKTIYQKATTKPSMFNTQYFTGIVNSSDLIIASARGWDRQDSSTQWSSEHSISFGKLLSQYEIPMTMAESESISSNASTLPINKIISVVDISSMSDEPISLFSFDKAGNTIESKYNYYWYVVQDVLRENTEIEPLQSNSYWTGALPPFNINDQLVEQVSVDDAIKLVHSPYKNLDDTDYYSDPIVFSRLSKTPIYITPYMKWKLNVDNVYKKSNLGIFSFRQRISSETIKNPNEINFYENEVDASSNQHIAQFQLQDLGITDPFEISWIPKGELKSLKIKTVQRVKNSQTKLYVKIPVTNYAYQTISSSGSNYSRVLSIENIDSSLLSAYSILPFKIGFINGAGANRSIDIIIEYELKNIGYNVSLSNNGDFGTVSTNNKAYAIVSIENTGTSSLFGNMRLIESVDTNNETIKSGFKLINTIFNVQPSTTTTWPPNGTPLIEYPNKAILYFDPTQVGQGYGIQATLAIDFYLDDKLTHLYKTETLPLKVNYSNLNWNVVWNVSGTIGGKQMSGSYVDGSLLKDFDSSILNSQMIKKLLGLDLSSSETSKYYIQVSTSPVYGEAQLDIVSNNGKTIDMNNQINIKKQLSYNGEIDLDETKIVMALYGNSSSEDVVVNVSLIPNIDNVETPVMVK